MLHNAPHVGMHHREFGSATASFLAVWNAHQQCPSAPVPGIYVFKSALPSGRIYPLGHFTQCSALMNHTFTPSQGQGGELPALQ